MTSWLSTFAIASAFLLTGCNSQPPQKPEDIEAARKLKAHIERMADPKQAIPEFIADLRSKVRLADGLLIVQSYPWDYRVLPPTSSWVVKCGLALEVSFGTTVPGDGGSPPDETAVQLYLSPPFGNWCESVAPAIGKEVQLILNGH